MDHDEKFCRSVELVQTIRAQLSPFERDQWDSAFAVAFAHHSTTLEGNPLTLAEVKLLLIDGLPPAGRQPEHSEAVRRQALAAAYADSQRTAGAALTADLILAVHQRLAPADGYAGRYRDVNIRLCGTEHIPPDYDEIGQQIGFLLAGYQTEAELPLDKAAQLHAGLTHIHPFRSGSGQVARILTNYVLQAQGWPPVNLTAGNAARYLNALDIYNRKRDSRPLARLLQEEMAGEIKTFLALYKQRRRQGI